MHVNPGGDIQLIQKFRTKEKEEDMAGWLPPEKMGENLWADTLDVIEEPVLFFRQDGTVSYTNPAALSFYGVEEADLLDLNCYEMVRRFGLRFSECPYEEVLKNGKAKSGMLEYNGVWHEHRVNPILSENGEIQGMVSVIQDGDERLHLAAASEELDFLLAATGNAVLITGADQRIVQWNPGFTRTFGYQAKDLEGKLIHDLVPLTSRKIFEAYADRVMNGEIIPEFSFPSLSKNGDGMNVAVSMAPLHDPGGTVSGIMVLLRTVADGHDVDVRLIKHLSDTSEKINGPLSHMRVNLEDTVVALQDGLLTTEELVIFLTVLMKSVGHIEEGLREMNAIAIDGIDFLPEEFRKYLSQP